LKVAVKDASLLQERKNNLPQRMPVNGPEVTKGLWDFVIDFL